MMPGENQSKALAIAADATTGNCQNCSVLQQVGDVLGGFFVTEKSVTVLYIIFSIQILNIMERFNVFLSCGVNVLISIY